MIFMTHVHEVKETVTKLYLEQIKKHFLKFWFCYFWSQQTFRNNFITNEIKL